jgi:membrane protease YdiL (CAAX protease family)
MQFPVSPWGHFLTPVTWGYALWVGALIPGLMIVRHIRGTKPGAFSSRPRLYASALFSHAIFALLAWFVARDLGVQFLGPIEMRASHLLVGAIGLAAGLLPLLPAFHAGKPVNERTKQIAPRTSRDHALFYVVCASAGVVEELAYRGAFFTLLAILTGSWWIAAVLASAAFGLAHLSQGWKGAVGAGVIGMFAQLIVGLTGTLFVAMAVHTLHDVVTGTAISRRVRREEASLALS